MKKLAALALNFLLLAALAACQLGATPTPTAQPSATPSPSNTPPPPTITPTPTELPLPPLNSTSGPPLSFIRMFNIHDGWGQIADSLLVTHDGGVNWFSVPLPGGQVTPDSSLFLIDMNNLYVLVPAPGGQGGLLFHTTNGGGTWENFPTPFAHGKLSMNYNIGYFVETTPLAEGSEAVVIYLSIDFGVTWKKAFPSGPSVIPDAGLKTGFSLITQDRGWMGITGQAGKILLFRTEDAGHNWTTQALPEPQNIANLVSDTQPGRFFAGDEQNGLLPVDFTTRDGSERSRVFYATTDGGDTWTPGESVPEGGAYDFLDPRSGWMWGKGGIYHTSDGGQTWQHLPVAFGRSEHATCLSFVDVNTGWMTTADSRNRVRIYTTLDGGSTWMAVNP